jgi:hypothetical protein
VLFRVDPAQIGGRLSLHLDRPDGKEIGAVSIDQMKRTLKAGADQTDHAWKEVSCKLMPERGIHHLYIVYHDPENAKSGIWTTLFLDTIEFRK